ncbi:MAG: peptidoglycan-binding protein [Acidobacteriota bacterium]|nr:peptidoglycan-binding protein [Acidobacteriota bacterium]
MARDPELTRGARGARVRELHDLLDAIGLSSADDPGTFADATAASVEAFQRSRGLPITGVVDATTWARLEEAGWRLGQRLLFASTPHLRGDDVAELQTRLAQLGFNPGRIDGIFGPVTEGALRDFQRNRQLGVDGTVTRATLNDLLRLSSTATGRHLVNEARDVAGFFEPATRLVVLCGEGPLLDALERALEPVVEVCVARGEVESCAATANERDAALAIAVAPVAGLEGVRLHYWASYRSHSLRGDRLAGEIAGEIARTGALSRVEVTGMALPVLRETRMTTLHVEHGELVGAALVGVAQAVAQSVASFFHR